MTIEAIGFDLDDTLYDRSDIYKDVFTIMESEVVATNLDFEEFNEEFEKNSQNEYNLFIEGKQDRKTYRIQRVMKTYKHFGYQITETDAAIFENNYVENQNNLKFREGAVELIEYLLDQEIIIFLLTNGPSAGQRNKIKALRIIDWFTDDKIFISDELSLTKPDLEIFEYIENQLNLKGEEILYIGDDLTNDILGSQKANWHSIYFNNQPEQYERLENVSNASSFEQVKDILKTKYNL